MDVATLKEKWKKRNHMKNSDFLHTKTEWPDEDLHGEGVGSSSILVWSATCSSSNYVADQLCSKEQTSFLSWFKRASKSSFIERISGKAQNISEVQIITLHFFYLPALTQEETKRLSSCPWRHFHSITAHAEPAVMVYAPPHVICQTQESFMLTSDVSHSELHSTSFKNVLSLWRSDSLCILPNGTSAWRSFHFTSYSHPSRTVHCFSFVPIIIES